MFTAMAISVAMLDAGAVLPSLLVRYLWFVATYPRVPNAYYVELYVYINLVVSFKMFRR